jgi:hypothetical protein
MRKIIRPKTRKDDANAFITEADQATGTRDDLAEHLAEEFLRSASSGEDMEEDARDEVLAEEIGGPFIESGPEEEFGTSLEPEVGEASGGGFTAAYPGNVPGKIPGDVPGEIPGKIPGKIPGARARGTGRSTTGGGRRPPASERSARGGNPEDGEPSALPEAVGSLAIAGADELEEAAEDESEDDDSELREPARARITGERAHLLVDIEPASRVEPPSISTGTNKG